MWRIHITDSLSWLGNPPSYIRQSQPSHIRQSQECAVWDWFDFQVNSKQNTYTKVQANYKPKIQLLKRQHKGLANSAGPKQKQPKQSLWVSEKFLKSRGPQNYVVDLYYWSIKLRSTEIEASFSKCFKFLSWSCMILKFYLVDYQSSLVFEFDLYSYRFVCHVH